MKGAYVLILMLGRDKDILVGKLGRLHFKKGFYAYSGSARGQGGFKRVERHFDVAEGFNKTRKWHIDYLLPCSEVVCAVLMPEYKFECKAAETLREFSSGIRGFGCSDCSCPSHLFFACEDLKNNVIDACNKLTGNESIIISPHI